MKAKWLRNTLIFRIRPIILVVLLPIISRVNTKMTNKPIKYGKKTLVVYTRNSPQNNDLLKWIMPLLATTTRVILGTIHKRILVGHSTKSTIRTKICNSTLLKCLNNTPLKPVMLLTRISIGLWKARSSNSKLIILPIIRCLPPQPLLRELVAYLLPRTRVSSTWSHKHGRFKNCVRLSSPPEPIHHLYSVLTVKGSAKTNHCRFCSSALETSLSSLICFSHWIPSIIAWCGICAKWWAHLVSRCFTTSVRMDLRSLTNMAFTSKTCLTPRLLIEL